MKTASLFVAASLVLCAACHDNAKPPQNPTDSTPVIPGPSPSQPINGPDNNGTSTDPALSQPPQAGTGNYGSTGHLGGNYGNYGSSNTENSGYQSSQSSGNSGSAGASGSMGSDTSSGSSGSSLGATSDRADVDTKLSQDIHKALIDANGLSASAKNVDVDVTNGLVTLRGQVKSEMEHKKVLAAAKKIAGEEKVTDQITVKK